MFDYCKKALSAERNLMVSRFSINPTEVGEPLDINRILAYKFPMISGRLYLDRTRDGKGVRRSHRCKGCVS